MLSWPVRVMPHEVNNALMNKNYNRGIIAGELGLDSSDAMYEPRCAAHTPGVAKVAAVALCRTIRTIVRICTPCRTSA